MSDRNLPYKEDGTVFGGRVRAFQDSVGAGSRARTMEDPGEGSYFALYDDSGSNYDKVRVRKTLFGGERLERLDNSGNWVTVEDSERDRVLEGINRYMRHMEQGEYRYGTDLLRSLREQGGQ